MSASAADLTWLNGTADLNTGTNWSGGAVPGTADKAVFDGTSAQVNPNFGANFQGGGSGVGGMQMTGGHTANLSITATTPSVIFRLATGTGITVDAGAGQLSFGASGSSFFLNLGGASGSYPLVNNSSNPVIIGANASLNAGGGLAQTAAFSGTGNWTFNGPILSTVAVTKTGTGTLTYNNAANSYSGATVLDQGSLVVGAAQTLSGALTFGLANASANAATLDLSSASANFAGTLTVRNNSATANTVTIGSGRNLTIGGGLTLGYDAAGGTGAKLSRLTMTGAGALVLNGATVNIGVNQAATNAAYWNDATLDVSGLASFTSNNTTFNVGVGGTTQGPGTLVLSNTANLLQSTTLTVGDTGANNGRGNGRITLGTGTNVLQADTLNIGRGKNTGPGIVSFVSQTAGSPGTLTIANKAGSGAANITVGDNNGTATGGGALGTLDLRGHVVSVNANSFLLGRNNMNSLGGSVTGTFAMDAGTMAVTTLNMAPKTNAGTGAANAFFTLGGGTVTVNSGGSVTLGSHSGSGSSSATLAINGGTLTSNADITAGGGTTTSTLILNGGTLDLAGFALGGATPIDNLTIQSGTFRNIGQINNGATGFAKTTTGTLTLAGTNAFGGGVNVVEGTLKLGAANVIPNGATAGNVTLSPAVSTTATLDISGFNDAINGLASSGAGSAIVDNTGAGAVTLTIGDANSAPTTTYNGVIQDTGGNLSLVKTGNGTQTLGGANTFSGNVTVNDGILALTHSSALGDTAKTVTVAGNAGASPTLTPELQLSGGIAVQVGTLLTSGSGVGVGSGVIRNISGNNSITATTAITLTSGNGSSFFQSDAGTLTLNGPIAPNATARGLILQGDGNGVINGAINNGAGANTLASLTKTGAGEWTLNNAVNGHTSKTAINGGILNIPTGSEATLGNPAAATDALGFNGGTLRVSTANLTINDPGRGVALGASGGTFLVDSGVSYTLSNSITGPSGQLNKAGAGTFNLTGGAHTLGSFSANTGNFVHSAGTVSAPSGSIASGATYRLTGGVLRLDALNIGGDFDWAGGSLTHYTTGTSIAMLADNSSVGFQEVGVGRTATVTGDLSSGAGAVLALHGSPTLYESLGIRFNNFSIIGSLALAGVGDVLEMEFNPYLLRPFSTLGEGAIEFGSLPLVTWTGSYDGNTFDTVTGIVNDGRGFALSTFSVVDGSALDINTYFLEYDAAAKTLWFHYKVNGYVPEPDTFALLALSVIGLRTARTLRERRRRMA